MRLGSWARPSLIRLDECSFKGGCTALLTISGPGSREEALGRSLSSLSQYLGDGCGAKEQRGAAAGKISIESPPELGRNVGAVTHKG